MYRCCAILASTQAAQNKGCHRVRYRLVHPGNSLAFGNVMYNQTKLDSKKISNSQDVVETVTFFIIIMSPRLDLDLEDSKPTFA